MYLLQTHSSTLDRHDRNVTSYAYQEKDLPNNQ